MIGYYFLEYLKSLFLPSSKPFKIPMCLVITAMFGFISVLLGIGFISYAILIYLVEYIGLTPFFSTLLIGIAFLVCAVIKFCYVSYSIEHCCYPKNTVTTKFGELKDSVTAFMDGFNRR